MLGVYAVVVILNFILYVQSNRQAAFLTRPAELREWRAGNASLV